MVRLLRDAGSRGALVACLCAGALAVMEGPAFAAPGAPNPFGGGTDPAYPGSMLHVSATATGSVMTITATGTNAPQNPTGLGPYGNYGLVLFVFDPHVLRISCPQAEASMMFIATNNPAAAKQLNFRDINEGVSGPFSTSLPVSARIPGTLGICAYTQFILDDAAWASAEVTIGGSKPSKPSVTRRPHVSRSGGRLRCSRGSWAGSPTSYRYRWLVLHKRGVAGRKASLVVTGRLRGHAVRCSVTAMNAAGSTTAASPPVKVT